MDLNFNNYICSVIALSLINPSNFWGAVHRDYTGQNNALVLENLRLIAKTGRQSDCIVRIPLIPGYNTDADRDASRKALEALGFTRFDLFTYHIRKH